VDWEGLSSRLYLPEHVLSRASRSVIHPTRLETRTKESNICASHSVLTRLEGRNESKWYDPGYPLVNRGPGRSTDPPTSLTCGCGGV